MKKILYGLGGAFLLVMVGGFLARDYLGIIAMAFFMEPDHGFEEKGLTEAPDYRKPENWAALPDREDAADVLLAPGIWDRQADAEVDVFFVHPTTYVSSSTWNQPMGDEGADNGVDSWVMRGQASAFNGCCKVYAPRYRQATLFSFQDQTGSGEMALDLAYQDVRSAFLFFLREYNQGRPFILAGHSQGSKHADRLLEEEVANSEILIRMVAAYPVGFAIDGSNGVPVCEQPDQINCQVSWNANTFDARVKLGQPGDICVNPISWLVDEASVPASDNLGSVIFSGEGKIVDSLADARCNQGELLVSEVDSERYDSMPFGPGNYHMYDYSFYYMNIRENAQRRVDRYWSQQAGKRP